MVRQAHHERYFDRLQYFSPFALSLSKGDKDFLRVHQYWIHNDAVMNDWLMKLLILLHNDVLAVVMMIGFESAALTAR